MSVKHTHSEAFKEQLTIKYVLITVKALVSITLL